MWEAPQARKMGIAYVNKGVGGAAGAKNGWKTFFKWNLSLKRVFFGACGEQLFEIYIVSKYR